MKKPIIVIILLAVVAAGAFYVIKILPGSKKVSSLENLVSEDALFYASSYNLDKKIKELQAGNFFTRLSKTAVYKTWIQPRLNEIYQNAPFLSDFLQEDFAVALLSLGNLSVPQASIQDVGDFLALVRLDPKKRAQIKTDVAGAYLSVAGKGKITSKVYKGIKISKYISLKPAFTINYAFIADVLALSNNANAIQKSIDLYQKTAKINSLSENSSFRNIRAKIKKDAWVWAYHNNERYNQQLLAYYASGALRSKGGQWAAIAMDPAQLAPMMELMNIVRASGFSLECDILKDGFLWKGYYLLAEPKSKAISELTKFFTDKKNPEEKVLRLVPRDVMAYVGMGKDISALWRFMKYSFSQTLAYYPGEGPSATAEGASKEIKAGLNKIESFLGMSIEGEILPMLGDNFGFVLAGLEDTAVDMLGSAQAAPAAPAPRTLSIALPQAYSYFEVKDVAKMRAMLEGAAAKLVDKANQQISERERRWKQTLGQKAPASSEQQGQDLVPQEEAKTLTLRKDTYQETEITYIDVLSFPIASIKPNYCFLDKYVIFSYSLPLTKKVIDIYKNKASSFEKNLSFTSMRDKVGAGYSDIAFFDIKYTVDELKRVKFFDSILYQILRSATPQAAAKEEVGEFLDVLSDLSGIISVNKVSDKDTLENNMYIKIKGL